MRQTKPFMTGLYVYLVAILSDNYLSLLEACGLTLIIHSSKSFVITVWVSEYIMSTFNTHETNKTYNLYGYLTMQILLFLTVRPGVYLMYIFIIVLCSQKTI
jgi:hypothetical protein